MRIACVGAGSIGMLVAFRLAAAGTDTTLITRTGEQAELLNETGVHLLNGGAESVVAIRARSYESKTAPLPDGAEKPYDWVFLTVKQKHITEPLLDTLHHLLGEQGKLVCFQNGIGHVEKLEERFPLARIYLAVTTEGAKKLSPSRVAHTGQGWTTIGHAGTDIGGKERNLLEKTMNEAGFRTFLSNQMIEIVWNKLLINAVINPLTALLRLRNGELPASEARRRLMRDLLEEGLAAANASGIRTREDVWEQLLDVCAKTAGNHSSMLQDVSEGRITEIDWINGAMLEAGARHGVPMPHHESVYRLIKAAEPAEPATT
ncbi:ketopantoate reductase family protein [Paenibacillus oceani]|uniref:2-dehydropantoate 2-reductase n=1 Tax=Paenibacillus oceani TaxID=2772510 RepID=A0A927GZ25_9BACL|nr:2-dehydropantoate 2-reductase [Paenibacillus oceani]MBD2861798.1 2-dehydropantoate 2-reductase [Paenibacillus oceani]